MVILFIVIGNEVLKCYGIRFCEPGNAVELTRLWQIGFVEVMFEGLIGGAAMKIYRRLSDKISPDKDKADKIIDPRELGK